MGRRKRRKDWRRWALPPDIVPSLAWCVPCAKKAFTKNNARKLIRVMPDKAGMREYPCPVHWEALGWWHAGHLPWTVRRGQMTADEAYGGKDHSDDGHERAA